MVTKYPKTIKKIELLRGGGILITQRRSLYELRGAEAYVLGRSHGVRKKTMQ